MDKYNLKKAQNKFIRRIETLIAKDESFKALMLNVKKSPENIFTQVSRLETKVFEQEWIEALEKGFDAIDNIVRNPARFIKDVRSVTPVALAKRITSESVVHLASHTQFVHSVDAKGNVLPEKVLSLSSEDDYAIYENRFIFTLINKVVFFLEKRYDYIKKHTETRNSDVLIINSKFNIGDAICEFKGTIKISIPSPDDGNKNKALFNRIITLRKKAGYFLNCDFVKRLEDVKPVRAPILQTNMLLKNPNYKQAYRLWRFIDAYSKLGVKYSVKETSATFNDRYLQELYALTLANILTLETEKSAVIDFKAPRVRKKAYVPKIRKSLEQEMFDNERLANEPVSEEAHQEKANELRLLDEEKRKIELDKEKERAKKERLLKEEKLRKAKLLEEKRKLAKEKLLLQKEKERLRKEKKQQEEAEILRKKKEAEALKKKAADELKREKALLERTRAKVKKAAKGKNRKKR